MTTVFFKKELPATPIWLSNGRKITFDTIDGRTGYTLSADPNIIAQLDGCIARGIGGVSRATPEEYEAFAGLKKNSTPQRKSWRDELTPQEVMRGQSIAVAPVAVGSSITPASAPVPKVAPAPAPAPVPAQSQTFKPKTARKPKAGAQAVSVSV